MPQLSDDWTLEFAPEMGGSVTLCQFQGVDILRPAVSLDDPRMCSAFPMVPFIGRITNGKFVFEGRTHTLSPNMPPEPHAIHGRGWQTPWEITQTARGQFILEQTYKGADDWPYPYQASQSFAATDETLHITMALKNISSARMPAGLGWHPYFPKAGAQVSAGVSAIWDSAEEDIIGHRPCALKPANDLRDKRCIDTLNLDHCYTATDGRVTLEWPEREMSINISSSKELGFLTVYTPPGENYFCVEPVSHIPDAINSKLAPQLTGFRILQPGETFESHIAISVALGKA